jgi:hypothetical protein
MLAAGPRLFLTETKISLRQTVKQLGSSLQNWSIDETQWRDVARCIDTAQSH